MSRDSWATPMAVYMAMDSEFDFCGDMCADDGNAKHPVYITEADDALASATIERVVSLIPSGNYVWINPPYSNTTPWVALAIQLQERGIGSVMLAMDDSSVGWYWDALQRCNEIREVVKGRIAFVNSETGLPVSGNNKGSKFLMFDPYGRQSPPRRTYIERDQLMLEGGELMQRPDLLFPHGSPVSSECEPAPPEQVPLSSELEPLSSELEPLSSELPAPAPAEPEPKTEFTPDDLHHLYLNGELKADHFPTFLTALVVIFGERDIYSLRSVRGALVAEANANAPTGEEGVNIGPSKHQLDFIKAAGWSLPFYKITEPAQQVAAIGQLIAKDALRKTTIAGVLTRFLAKQAEETSA